MTKGPVKRCSFCSRTAKQTGYNLIEGKEVNGKKSRICIDCRDTVTDKLKEELKK